MGYEYAMTTEGERRRPLIDFVRGFAVTLMIAYHTAYFLNYNGLAEVPLFESDFWFNAPRVIVSLFLLCSGASIYLASVNGIRWRRYFKRFGVLALLAGLITLGTWIFFRTSFIFCGILHCAAGSSLLVLPVLLIPSDRIRPWVAFLIGSALVVLSRLNVVPNLPPRVEGVVSMDYIPVIPWAAPVFIGIFLGSLFIKIPRPGTGIAAPESVARPREITRFFGNPVYRFIVFLGKKSLWVYFIHIAVIFGITAGVAAIFR